MGITIVMITHDISAVTVHANKIAFMSNKTVQLMDSDTELTPEVMSELYGYEVSIHRNNHKCMKCENYLKKGVV
jgi:zinc transport system ATP-binding protein